MTEFSRIYDFALPSILTSEQKITASSDEKEALAKRFGILSVDTLEAKFRIEESAQDQCFKVSGTLTASITQESVVSLKPVHEEVNVPLNVKIRLHSDENPDEDMRHALESGAHIDDIDDTEHVPSSKVDVGELVAQYLSLSMEPYPRASDEDAADDIHVRHHGTQNEAHLDA